MWIAAISFVLWKSSYSEAYRRIGNWEEFQRLHVRRSGSKFVRIHISLIESCSNVLSIPSTYETLGPGSMIVLNYT